MSPVFGHGRLRLYLLKLLDEAPRHGYEVIRLLQDRFMGVYAPSPGTIYPRLARLEEEGLLTHDEEDGRKIYRITDKGREEINRRLDELEDLEQEITESVSGIAREVKEDVRETVRNLREELTWASREVHKETKRSAEEEARLRKEEVRARARQIKEELQVRGDARGRAGDRPGAEQRERADRPRSDRPGWQDWAEWTNWTDWPGRRQRPGPGGYREFETFAREFSNEVRRAVKQAGALSEGALDDLRHILEDALQRMRSEVFGPLTRQRDDQGSDDRGDDGEPAPGTAADKPRGGGRGSQQAPEPGGAPLDAARDEGAARDEAAGGTTGQTGGEDPAPGAAATG